jgi:membrane associated rhomboid family serine protease
VSHRKVAQHLVNNPTEEEATMPPIGIVPLLDIRHILEGKSRKDALSTFFKNSLVTIAIIATCTLLLFTPWAAHNLQGAPLYGVNTQDIVAQIGSLNPLNIAGIVLAMLRATFVHNGWEHLLFNMVLVLAFGPTLEARLGRIRFLLLFIGASLISMLVSAAMAPHTVLLGASAAGFALAGAFLCLRPRAYVAGAVLVGLPGFIAPIPFLLRASWVIPAILLAQVYYKFGDLSMFAHFIGFIAGYVAMLFVQWKDGPSAHDRRTYSTMEGKPVDCCGTTIPKKD